MGNWRAYLKVYYCVMLVLFVLSLLSGFEEPLDVVNALISAFVFVGAYGFLAKVAIGTRGFWQFYFWLLGISTVVSFVVGTWYLREEMTVGLMVLLLFVAVLWLPMFMIIWLYGFVDKEPWSTPGSET